VVPYKAPESQVEQTIAAIWQEVLKVEKVGIHNNFFDLGGHSLLMVQVHDKLCKVLGTRFSMVELFRHPTIAALARYVGQAEVGDVSFKAIEDRAQKQRAAMQWQGQRMKGGRGKR
jgi:acyl carrier protein